MALRVLRADDLRSKIEGYEAQYGMTTAEFLDRWRDGTVYETPDFIDWAMLVKALEQANGPLR